MGYLASDFQRGVEWAAGVLKKDGFIEEADKILKECPPDFEGTEARTVKQIATFLEENALAAGPEADIVEAMAQDVRDGAWKPR